MLLSFWYHELLSLGKKNNLTLKSAEFSPLFVSNMIGALPAEKSTCDGVLLINISPCNKSIMLIHYFMLNTLC